MNEENRFGDRFGNSPLPHLLDKALKNTQEELRKAKEMSETDALTGIFNRRTFNVELPASIGRIGLRRESDPDYVLLFIADVNKFKFINDTYGHAKGDEAVVLVAKAIQQEAQERGGKAIRFAGDEFAIIQEGRGVVNGDQLSAIALRVQEKINALLSIETKDGNFTFTISVGCAVVKKETMPKDKTKEELAGELIKEADANMYVQKRAQTA